MTVIMYQLPWPPSLNRYYRTFKGRVLISKIGRDYRKSVITSVGSSGMNLDGRLLVKICAYMPDNRRRDLDNLTKCLLDSMTYAKIWLDDSQIDNLQIIRKPVERGGRIVVSVSILDKENE